MVQYLIIDFLQNICGYDYYIIRLLCGNYTSLHCPLLHTYLLVIRIKATVPSTRDLNWQKNQVEFCPINWELKLMAYAYKAVELV